MEHRNMLASITTTVIAVALDELRWVNPTDPDDVRKRVAGVSDLLRPLLEAGDKAAEELRADT